MHGRCFKFGPSSPPAGELLALCLDQWLEVLAGVDALHQNHESGFAAEAFPEPYAIRKTHHYSKGPEEPFEGLNC